jgi:phosphatidate cytidylyltransferase
MTVPDADPGKPSAAAGASRRELALRVASALVLAPLALGAAYIGGSPFAIFWGLAALGIFWEWTWLVVPARRVSVLGLGAAALLIASALGAYGSWAAALLVIAAAAAAIAVMVPVQRGWAAAGLPYAGAIGIAPILLRSDAQEGFLAVVLLFAIVWATDSAAYFVGRWIGGPKLLPRVSPGKTWSGAAGGLFAAVLAAVVAAGIAGLPGGLALAAIAAALSAFAQAGDLFESLLKRRFGAKDSSRLIPGHGGLMDRLDGFVAAAALAALIGVLRGGIEAPARGLLIW